MINKLIQKMKNMSGNNRIIFDNIIGAFAVRGLALIVSLFTMPAYLRFFNNEIVLGLWFTVLSVLNWILNFDLGIGNGLRNNLTRTITQKNIQETKRYLSSAYVSVGFLCGLLSVICLLAFDFFDWNSIFNIKEEIVSDKALILTVKLVFMGIMVQMFLKLITSVLYALQKSSVNNFLTLCTSVITLICVLVLPSGNNDENMIVMAVVHMLAVAIPLIVATVVVFFSKALKKCRPSIKDFNIKHSKDILSLGSVFLFVQLEYMIIMSTNEYLITAFHSNEAVVDYQIYNRIFSLVCMLFSLALTPIWSAVTKAYTEKDYNWINSLYKKLLLLVLLGTMFEFLLIPFLQIFVNLWLGNESITINHTYSLAFAFLGSLMICNSVLSSIANGIGHLKTQAIFFGIGAVIKAPIAWGLIYITNSWIGVVWANVISMAFYCIVQPFWFKKHILYNKNEG